MPSSYTDIDLDAYKADFEAKDASEYVLIDVREEDEYADGHLARAVNVPLSELETRFGEITTEKPVVLVCARGGRSATAAQFLVTKGYKTLYNLDGGTLGWIKAGHPVEK